MPIGCNDSSSCNLLFCNDSPNYTRGYDSQPDSRGYDSLTTGCTLELKTMLQISDLTKYFGARKLFENITWQLDRFKRTALVGHNGAGKSTLLKILSGSLEADGGTVILPKNVSIGYLPQEITHMDRKPALDLVLSGRQDLLQLENEIERLQQAIEENPTNENIAAHAEKQQAFETQGGYQFRADAKSIMASLGFCPEEFLKLTTEFSGGWQMRILLAKLLLAKHELLLLDEPTNHLDMASLAWLENFLSAYTGTLIIVSHDRAFLNRVVDGVAALDDNGLLLFPGNYDHYLELREALEEQLEKTAEHQKQRIAEKQAFIEKFRYKASKAKQVQSRVKQLEKMTAVTQLQHRKKIHFHFPEPDRVPQILLELKHVSKAYDDNVVYRDLDFRVYRGDKMALVAPNGAGKSTLIKMLANSIDFQGERILSDRVKLAHFAQHQIDALDFDRTLLEEASADLPANITITQIRASLGAFLFTNEDMDKTVSILSGGEKNKLALAKILLRAPNLLLLDEPTNHLDLDSREALEEALIHYPGAIVVISHDRWFIDKVCHKIVTIEHGHIDIFDGTYSEREIFMASRTPKDSVQTAQSSPHAQKQKRIESAQQRSAIKKATGHIEKRIHALEAEIARLEASLAALDVTLSDPETYKMPEKIRTLAMQKSTDQAKLDETMDAWMAAQAELEDAMVPFQA